MKIDQKIWHQCRSKDNTREIQDHQRWIEQVQLQHTGAETVREVPDGEISVADMVYDGIELHDILLLRVGTNVIEDKDGVSKNILVIYET